MLSSPVPDEPAVAELRGILFTRLDRLAFALEMEAAELIEAGLEDEVRCRQDLRLGVRLAQRLVAGIYAEEVDARISRYADEYDARLTAVSS
jgi:hypothetical protein